MARYVRLSTIAYKPVEAGEDFAERTREKMAADLELAAQAKPDLVAFPEFSTVMGLGKEAWTEGAEPIPGPTTDRLAEVAVKHRMNQTVSAMGRVQLADYPPGSGLFE